MAARRIGWLAGSLALVGGVYVAGGYLAVPALVRQMAPGWVQSHLHRQLRLGAVRFDPFRFSLVIEDLAIANGAEPLVSARRIALALIKRKETLLEPLAQTLEAAARSVKVCSTCGNFDSVDPCTICGDPRRDDAVICVVEDVADVWALERTGAFRGRYHVTGGLLSPLDGIGPGDLKIEKLAARATAPQASCARLLPALRRRTPRPASTCRGGSPARAITARGSGWPATSAAMSTGAATPGTNNASAPASA